MGFIMENAERAVRERFILGEAPYREPTPLIPSGSKKTSLKYDQQPARYPSAYTPFLTPPEQKEAAAANNQRNQETKIRAASIPINIIMAYVIPAPEPGMPGAPYFAGQEVTKFLIQ